MQVKFTLSDLMLIKIAQCDRDIDRCFPVMYELRPHLLHAEFVSRIKYQQQQYNYQLAYLENAGNITTVAGFRISESLSWGKYLYVDDLVTAASDRKVMETLSKSGGLGSYRTPPSMERSGVGWEYMDSPK